AQRTGKHAESAHRRTHTFLRQAVHPVRRNGDFFRKLADSGAFPRTSPNSRPLPGANTMPKRNNSSDDILTAHSLLLMVVSSIRHARLCCLGDRTASFNIP